VAVLVVEAAVVDLAAVLVAVATLAAEAPAAVGNTDFNPCNLWLKTVAYG
jgi:hypothetical protein